MGCSEGKEKNNADDFTQIREQSDELCKEIGDVLFKNKQINEVSKLSQTLILKIKSLADDNRKLKTEIKNQKDKCKQLKAKNLELKSTSDRLTGASTQAKQQITTMINTIHLVKTQRDKIRSHRLNKRYANILRKLSYKYDTVAQKSFLLWKNCLREDKKVPQENMHQLKIF
ncbi:unnamed protein product [Blepharisma stoltei]|uniref:Uncharacterized protein n=1 Tax=Blepharisma stoltei TaxID=1481888 RepID=A0AAU9JTP8_9CILI|nr:unnamed protein product [Blepharisma stoltei]